MKQIAYTIIDNGIEGREPDRIVSAFLSERRRDDELADSPNKNWYHKGEQIVDLEAMKKQLLAKLDGLEKLALFYQP